jgi:hypothetical protein
MVYPTYCKRTNSLKFQWRIEAETGFSISLAVALVPGGCDVAESRGAARQWKKLFPRNLCLQYYPHLWVGLVWKTMYKRLNHSLNQDSSFGEQGCSWMFGAERGGRAADLARHFHFPC